MKPSELRKTIQELLKEGGYYQGNIDGDFGPKSHKAFDDLDIAQDNPPPSEIHVVKASSFADPADVRAFERCKASGSSDMQCFKVGDNGIGLWGDKTAQEEIPMCALPREDWEEKWGKGQVARGKLVEVKVNEKTIVCELRDTMPRRANIKNKAGIDLNPAAVKQLGLNPPIFVTATWRWV